MEPWKVCPHIVLHCCQKYYGVLFCFQVWKHMTITYVILDDMHTVMLSELHVLEGGFGVGRVWCGFGMAHTKRWVHGSGIMIVKRH